MAGLFENFSNGEDVESDGTPFKGSSSLPRPQLYYNDLFESFINPCKPWSYLLSAFSSGGEVRLKYLLDLQSFVFLPCPSHIDSGTFTSQCGVALWLVDLASKNFIADCWRQRGRFLSGLASFNSVQLNIPVPTKKAV